MTQARPALEIVDLQKRYGDVAALQGVSFTVDRSEVFALLGPNGAGKSTLVHILTTLLSPDAGVARVAGHDVQRDPQAVRRRIGVAFQETTLDLDLTGREVLFYHGQLYGWPPARCREQTARLEPLMELGPALDRKVKTYSGGMKRRLELARALMTEPEVLFLDEPTLGLDPQNREAMWEQIHRHRAERGMTVVLTTHYMEEAERLADRVGIIDAGRILALGAPAELVQQLGGDVLHISGQGDPARLAAELRARGISQWTEQHGETLQAAVPDSRTALAAAVQAALDVGYNVRELTVVRPNLNEVFLKLTGRSLRD